MKSSLFSVNGNIAHNWMLSIFIMMCGNAVYSYTRLWYVLLVFVAVAFLYMLMPIIVSRSSAFTYSYPKKIVFECLIFCAVVIMIRGIVDKGISYEGFMALFPGPKVFMPYLFPLLLGCSAFSFDYRNFIKVSTICTFIFITLIIINLPFLIERSAASATYIYANTEELEFDFNSLITIFTAPLVLFLQREFLPKRIWEIAFLNIIFAIFLAALNARRSTIFGISLIFLIGCYKEKKLRWVSIISLFAVGCFMYYNGMLDFLIAKFDMDTRTGVEEGFYNDMDTCSWIFGRGATGTYFDPYATFLDQTGVRTEIETGYLYLILKGGIIYLAVYVLALLYAAWKGLRHSNNTFVRSFAIIILVSLFELIPYGIPTWNLKFFSIWMGVTICLNSKMRMMTNEDIKRLIRNGL